MTAVLVETNTFTIKHAVHASEGSGHVCREVSKGCEGVTVAGYEAAFTVLDVGECAESVEF